MATKMTAFKINCPLLDHLSKKYLEAKDEWEYDDDPRRLGYMEAYDEMLTWARSFVDISDLLSGNIESEVIDTHGKTFEYRDNPRAMKRITKEEYKAILWLSERALSDIPKCRGCQYDAQRKLYSSIIEKLKERL